MSASIFDFTIYKMQLFTKSKKDNLSARQVLESWPNRFISEDSLLSLSFEPVSEEHYILISNEKIDGILEIKLYVRGSNSFEKAKSWVHNVLTLEMKKNYKIKYTTKITCEPIYGEKNIFRWMKPHRIKKWHIVLFSVLIFLINVLLLWVWEDFHSENAEIVSLVNTFLFAIIGISAGFVRSI